MPDPLGLDGHGLGLIGLADEDVGLGLLRLGPQEPLGGSREAGGEVAGADGLVDVAREEGGAGGGGGLVGLLEAMAGTIEGAGGVHGGWGGGWWVGGLLVLLPSTGKGGW